MPKPVTPLVAADVFVLNERGEVLLIRRSDNGYWALPGGCQDLGETSAACAVRECFEESGYRVEVAALLGVYSSQCYEYVNYPWTENEFTHLLYKARLLGGEATLSSETTAVEWFAEDAIPELSDGHDVRIQYGFARERDLSLPSYFE